MLRLFGAKLRYLRVQKAMSQAALARLLAPASRGHLNNIEAGRRMPSLELVLKIAHTFTIATDYLLRDTTPLEAVSSYWSAYPENQPGRANSFGEKLRALRQQHALTQHALAQQLALQTQAHISLLEHGQSEPSLALVLKIADCFVVTTDYLLRDDLPVQDGAIAQKQKDEDM